jgi:hypothetical protein
MKRTILALGLIGILTAGSALAAQTKDKAKPAEKPAAAKNEAKPAAAKKESKPATEKAPAGDKSSTKKDKHNHKKKA